MGDPTVNIENQRFWNLHGWIDAMWGSYRNTTGRSDTDPRYLSALLEAEKHMSMPSPIGGFQPFGAAPWHMELHVHPPMKVPEDIKKLMLEALYFCDLT
jgi:hypothetical protein